MSRAQHSQAMPGALGCPYLHRSGVTGESQARE